MSKYQIIVMSFGVLVLLVIGYLSVSAKHEQCELIQIRMDELRIESSGGSCSVNEQCGIISQSCTSVPNAKADFTNLEFESLFSQAKGLDCKVDFTICEFVVPVCRESQCSTERMKFEPNSSE